MNKAILFLENNKTSPLGLGLIIAMSIAALIASARIQIPMVPVPITMQTAVVLLLPFMLGYRTALGVLTAYFVAGAAGLSVFAISAITGPAYFFGPTGGYLAGFAAAILFIGFVLKHQPKLSIPVLFGLMIFGHFIILALGSLWLGFGAPALGMQAAIATGLIPFIVGSILKSALAACVVKGFEKK